MENKLRSMLIVEDDPLLLDTLVSCVAKSGLVIHSATNGAEGLQKFMEHSPVIILSDIRMPILDGIEFLKAVRLQNKEVFFILMTGFSEITETYDAYKLGADEFLLKPFDVEELKELLSHSAKPHSLRAVEDKYEPVPMESFHVGEVLPSNLYLRLTDSKYILIIRKGDVFDIEFRMEKYKSKGVSQFHVKQSDLHLYEKNNGDKAS